MKKFLLIAAIIAVAAIVINYSLGGFKSVEPRLVSTDKTVLYGRMYEGSYSSDQLNELIEELRLLMTKSITEGQLTIVNYKQPELEKKGTVKQFVGIEWDITPSNAMYDSLIIEPYNGAQFLIPVRPLVMPSPEKLDGLAADFAQQMEASLAGFSIEMYQDQSLVINYPFKKD